MPGRLVARLQSTSSLGVWAAAALLVAYAAAVGLETDRRVEPVAALLLVVAVRGLAVLMALVARRQLMGTPAQRAWDYWCIGLALWALSDSLRLADWLSRDSLLSTPSLSDLLRLSGYLSAAASLASYPAAPAERFGQIRRWLDVIILTLAVGTLAWLVLIRPVLGIGLATPGELFWGASSAVLDLVLVTLAVRLLMLVAGTSSARLFGLLALGSLFLAMTDVFHGYQALQGGGTPGGWGDAGWMAAGVVFSAAGLWQARRRSAADEPGEAARRRSARLEPLLSVAFTYAVVGFTLLDWRFSGEVDWAGLTVAALLSLLLVSRQGVIAGQVEMRQFAAAVNASKDLIFICDPQGRLRLANPALRQLLGRPGRLTWSAGRRSGPEGIHLADLLGDGNPSEPLLRGALRDGWSGEVAFRRADGATVPVALSLTPVQDERRAQPLLLGTAHDLTQIRQRESDLRTALDDVAQARRELETLNRELERKVELRTGELAATVADLARLNEELKALDRLKSEFVALVSHELRAPLTNIRSGVELILHAPQALGETAQRTLDLVQTETIRLTRFIETILDLSALEAGKFPLLVQPQDLASLCELLRRRLPPPAGERLVIDLPADLPPLLADEAAFSSVLFHLIDNALKYGGPGAIRIGGLEQPGRVCISVSDSGPGIPEPERERIFEMFHRLDTSDSRQVYGYGLGLHLARRLLEAMGGGIRAEQSASGGTRMLFWLPAAPAAGAG